MNAKELIDKLSANPTSPLDLAATSAAALPIILRALRLLAAAEANDGSSPETYENCIQGMFIDAAFSRLFERERNGLAARVRELEHAVDLAARTMAGEGVEDQGQAWDKCLRILDAERSK